MDYLLSLWKVLALDMGERCAVDTTSDFIQVERRFEHEGREFLTISLPALGKAIEKWLDTGAVLQADCPGFRFSHGLPKFLGGFLQLVFEPSNGALRDAPNVDAILALRQLCGLYGKMFLPASPERTRCAMEQYLRTDAEVGWWEAENPLPTRATLLREWHFGAGEWPRDFLAFHRISMLLFHRVFDKVNHDLAYSALTPKHGPGSTADKLLGNKKFFADWTWRLEEFFSSDQYLLPSPRYHKLLEGVNFREPWDELPVEVISVPKTSKTPRIIAMEPVCMQYAQQAVSEAISKGIYEDHILKRFLALDRQEVNQLLAREGSITGALATLDLSEASDRVSNELVQFLTGWWRHLSGAIQACRSSQAIVRLGQEEKLLLQLSKFASMGSALTFPIESIVFLTLVFVGIERDIGRRLSRSDILGFSGKVAVYGDDLIVPTDHVGSVIHTLASFGFKVNSQKSFWTGKFRESCGKDYYSGIDVSYIKFRKEWPGDRRDVEEVVSLVSFFNQCNDAHYSQTVTFLRGKITDLLSGYFPRVGRDSAILGEWSDIVKDATRLNPDTHQPEAKGWVIKDHIPLNPLDGERALLKFFLKQGTEPYEREHLRRSGRSKAVSIKLCMAPV